MLHRRRVHDTQAFPLAVAFSTAARWAPQQFRIASADLQDPDYARTAFAGRGQASTQTTRARFPGGQDSPCSETKPSTNHDRQRPSTETGVRRQHHTVRPDIEAEHRMILAPAPSGDISKGLPSLRPIVAKNPHRTSNLSCPRSSRRSTSKSIVSSARNRKIASTPGAGRTRRVGHSASAGRDSTRSARGSGMTTSPSEYSLLQSPVPTRSRTVCQSSTEAPATHTSGRVPIVSGAKRLPTSSHSRSGTPPCCPSAEGKAAPFP